jgi:hypothetical protein
MKMQLVHMLAIGNGSILMHNPAQMRSTSDQPQRGGKRIPSPIEEATAGLYALPSGQLYIKSDCFREAALIAAKDVRDPTQRGRRNMVARFSASVFLTKEVFPIFRPDSREPITSDPKDWEIDVRRAVVQKNGILRARPKITNWACELEFEYDEEIIEPNLIVAIMKSAGKFPGVLDYRVGKKGPFGRFSADLAAAQVTKLPERTSRKKKAA